MAIGFRCWWPGISISGRSTSCMLDRHPDMSPVEVLPEGGTSAGAALPGEVSALELTLRALEPLLGDPDVTEICINRPREAYVESSAGWRCESLPFADF